MKKQFANSYQLKNRFCFGWLILWITVFNAYAQKERPSIDSITYFYNTENYQKGLELSERFLTDVEKKFSNKSPQYAEALFYKGRFLCRLNNWEEGMKPIFLAEKVLSGSKTEKPSLYAQIACYCALGCGFIADSVSREQIYLARVFEQSKLNHSDSNLVRAFYHYGQAIILNGKGKHLEALPFFHEAILQFEKAGYTKERDFMKTRWNLAWSYSELGRQEEEEQILAEMIKIYETSGKSHWIPLAEVYRLVSGLEMQAGVFSNMEKYALQALHIIKEVFGVNQNI